MGYKIIISPDVFYTDGSGAYAARKAAQLLSKMGHEVAVFSHETPVSEYDFYRHYQRKRFRGYANVLSKEYKKYFIEAISDFQPDYVFFIGGVIDTPVVYMSECRNRNIKTVFLLLVQDFYCARLHAGSEESSCTKCLTGTNLNSVVNRCLEKGSNKLLYFLNYQISQKLFTKELKNINYVLGSTDEQLGFYRKFGIPSNKCIKIPLFFPQERILTNYSSRGNYYVIIAQNRPEKGAHLISKIMKKIDSSIIIKAIFYNQNEADIFVQKYPENKKYINNGNLEILPNVTMENGAVELIANSRGVINPTIWATTTEFVFLEVLGIGKPIICFDVGIHKEVIKNRLNGIVVRSGDFQKIGDEINNLFNDDELYEVISANAKKLFHRLTDDIVYTSVLKKIFI